MLIPLSDGVVNDLLEDFIKLTQLLLLDDHVDVVDLVSDRVALFEHVLVIRKTSPVLDIPERLYQHLLVLYRMSHVSELVPLTQMP